MRKNQSTLSKILNTKFPTLLGMGVLIVALVGGVILATSEEIRVFAPRASAEQTPKQIKVTNVTDNSFTVSFLTDAETPGFVKYGTEVSSLNSQSSDDRDQLSGKIGEYQTHHITVRGLQPNTEYYYSLGTVGNTSFDDGGSPFTITTAQRNGAPPAAKTVYGNVMNSQGNPASGSIVYVSINGVGEMSSLVKDSGSWAIPLSNARKADGSGYAQVTDESTMRVTAQGAQPNLTAQTTATVANAQPVETLTLGQGGVAAGGASQGMNAGTGASSSMRAGSGDSAMDTDETPARLDQKPSKQPTLDDSGTGGLSQFNQPTSDSATEGDTATESGTATGSATTVENTTTDSTTTTTSDSSTVDVDSSESETVTTSQPKIKGKAAPQTTVDITVNSETQINQQLVTDAEGNYELDIAALSENLEPGEHSVQIAYTDPNTGEEVTKTKTFYVEDDSMSSDNASSQRLAQANTGTTGTTNTGGPYSSSNPYTGTASASPSPTATASASPSSTASGRVTMPSTDSAVPVSGSVGMTVTLTVGGLFFITAAAWSYWLAQQVEAAHVIVSLSQEDDNKEDSDLT